jgi:hypothetical protein
MVTALGVSHLISPDPFNLAITELPPCKCENSVTDKTSSLRTKISTASSFRELCPYARMAHPHVSLLGRRYVSVEGYKGTVGINAFPQRVLELIKQNPHFDEEERSHGKTIASRLDRLYLHSEELLAGSNIFTRSLGKLAERVRVLFGRSSSEFLWKRLNTFYNQRYYKFVVVEHYPFVSTKKDSYNLIFNFYTKTQYQTAFGVEPKRLPSWWMRNGTRYSLPFAKHVDFEERWRVPRKDVSPPTPSLTPKEIAFFSKYTPDPIVDRSSNGDSIWD